MPKLPNGPHSEFLKGLLFLLPGTFKLAFFNYCGVNSNGCNLSFRKPGLTGRGLYELKPDCAKDFNLYFYHFSRAEQSKVTA